MRRATLVALGVVTFSLYGKAVFAESFLSLPFNEERSVTCGFCCYMAGSRCHGGIDYRATPSMAIIAAASGRVEVVVDNQPNTYRVPRNKRRYTYGNYVQIVHPNGYQTIYAHLQTGTIRVSVGEEVRVGTVLALSDDSGYSTGPHLHFEVRDSSGRKVDPYGESPSYPNCGTNALWVSCPPVPASVDSDGDTWTVGDGDCDDSNRNIYPGAPERCNRLDDDCDRATDEDWPNLGRSCTVRVGVCERTGVWICEPLERGTVCDADYTTSPELCNNLDDDCDGETDEDFRLGGVCSVGLGVCERSGTYVCRDDGRDTRCTATPGALSAEVCGDTLDNDCDGETDEEGVFSCPGAEMIPIACFCIDRYEASRPIATATSSGWATGNDWSSQSIAGVRPWDIVNWHEARTACARVDKRLCTDVEWRRACEGPRGLLYPYGNTYEPLTCNGWDALPEPDVILPTGSMPRCISEEGVYDLSGNVWEWIINTWDGRDGGALGASSTWQDNILLLSCTVRPGLFTPEIQSGNVGFRCCWP